MHTMHISRSKSISVSISVDPLSSFQPLSLLRRCNEHSIRLDRPILSAVGAFSPGRHRLLGRLELFQRLLLIDTHTHTHTHTTP